MALSEHTGYETFFPENTDMPANQPVAVSISYDSVEGKNVLIITINV